MSPRVGDRYVPCKHFGDDPDAPGCCASCGEPREAHCKVCAGTRELVDDEGRWDCYACTGTIIYSRADVEALCAIAVAAASHAAQDSHDALLQVAKYARDVLRWEKLLLEYVEKDMTACCGEEVLCDFSNLVAALADAKVQP